MEISDVLVVGPRDLPAGEAVVWIDTGSGRGATIRVPSDRLTLVADDDGKGPEAFYRLSVRECRG